MVGKPQRYGALTVIPILAPMQDEPEWLTLAEAGGRVSITQVDDEGSVRDLRVANLGTCRSCSWTASSWWAPSRTAAWSVGGGSTGSLGCRGRRHTWLGRSLSNRSCRYRAGCGW